MANRRQGPEAKIIALFTALPEDSKRIVLDVIKGQQAPRPKSTTVPAAGKRSPRNKSVDSSAANTEAGTGNASRAGVCAVPGCGKPWIDPIHSSENDPYHVFHAAIKTRGAGV